MKYLTYLLLIASVICYIYSVPLASDDTPASTTESDEQDDPSTTTENSEPPSSSCKDDVCKLPACRCFGTTPNVDRAKLPQIVVISTDDALTQLNYDNIYKPLYFGRKTPDGCQIGATFFTPHEYTSYAVVHALYAKGFEIGVNSITKTPEASYWKDATEELLVKEFSGQKKILEKFGQVDTDDITGARVPLLQINGDVTYSALQKSGLRYDNSWTTREQKFWPYTLDYPSQQDCPVGKCPTEPHKGFWVLPVQDWFDLEDVPCATVSGCQNKPKDSPSDILTWLKSNFEKVYNGERIPFNIIINSGIFGQLTTFQDAFSSFLDYLKNLGDVYIVNQSQAIEWVQNPRPIQKGKPVFECIDEIDHLPKYNKTCKLKKNSEETRFMTIYGLQCPPAYPWLDNPEGNK